ncbi:hypothetical protein K490DRAFT_53362 [Saccharata proteae CBS 121410]|uniref:BTB domain-containing protein n=1 Tax=Saccharata proteae CBS 121410 TaxID=1314787 RepID=A0A9P4M092_9PEZI|nr:hypothetical protein K490DRAFT_53362 [Saccharata proteae CBS 121410]
MAESPSEKAVTAVAAIYSEDGTKKRKRDIPPPLPECDEFIDINKKRVIPDLKQLGDPDIIIEVGIRATPFYLERELLTVWSYYFRKCLDGAFGQDGSEPLHLPDIDVESFQLFVNWLYGRGKFMDTGTAGDYSQNRIDFDCYADMYTLADYLDIPHMRVDILTKLREHYRDQALPSPEEVQDAVQIFGSLPGSSPLCRLFTYIAHGLYIDSFESESDVFRRGDVWNHEYAGYEDTEYGDTESGTEDSEPDFHQAYEDDMVKIGEEGRTAKRPRTDE